jgi:hypothetical protein
MTKLGGESLVDYKHESQGIRKTDLQQLQNSAA